MEFQALGLERAEQIDVMFTNQCVEDDVIISLNHGILLTCLDMALEESSDDATNEDIVKAARRIFDNNEYNKA